MIAKSLLALLLLGLLAGAFWLGRATVDRQQTRDESATSELSTVASGVDRPSGSLVRQKVAASLGQKTHPTIQNLPPDESKKSAANPVVPLNVQLEVCKVELHATQLHAADLERERRTFHGEPIAARSDGPARFQERPLLTAVQGAFKSTGIVGRVDTVDCAEFPCIVYGRVNGDEEAVAKLEDANALSVYDQDIGVMLTWSSGDQARGQGTAKTSNRAKPSEISLFAFAFYSPADKAKYGETLDRRIRSRTAELWNELRPEDP